MNECQCVQRHVPLPTRLYNIKIGNDKIHLCPTTYSNVRDLLTSFQVHGTVPPGRITKHYSKYVREICFRIWKERQRM